MQRVYNFSPGPATLPIEVLEQIQKDLFNWHDLKLSIMELPHRSSIFSEIVEGSQFLIRKLLNIPKHYQVLFLAGGATMQFSAIPLNILPSGKKAAYITTGIWSEKAFKLAQPYGEVVEIKGVKLENGQNYLPFIEQDLDDYDYIYYTSNETINGLQYHELPVNTRVPLVCDMTSSIMSEPVDIDRYGIIFASAQKNLGQAGITIVIVRDDLLNQAQPLTPSVVNYQQQAAANSLLNTPPTFAWYVCYLMLQWIDCQGGVPAMQQRVKMKADKIYQSIDNHPIYQSPIHSSARSVLNMPFKLTSEALEKNFLNQAEQKGLVNLKGHSLIGGVRPSVYLGMPMAGVDALVEFMNQFARDRK